MGKQQSFKRRLKSTDRRRRRRRESAKSSPALGIDHSTPASRDVDVAASVATTILQFVADASMGVADRTVMSAMRSCLQGSASNDVEVSELASQLRRISDQSGVGQRAFRAALKEMLAIAQEHRDTDEADSFIRYLGLLAR